MDVTWAPAGICVAWPTPGSRSAPRLGDCGLRERRWRLVGVPGVRRLGPDLAFLAGIGQTGTLVRGQMP